MKRRERGSERGGAETHVLVFAAVLEAPQAAAVFLGRGGRHLAAFLQAQSWRIVGREFVTRGIAGSVLPLEL